MQDLTKEQRKEVERFVLGSDRLGPFRVVLPHELRPNDHGPHYEDSRRKPGLWLDGWGTTTGSGLLISGKAVLLTQDDALELAGLYDNVQRVESNRSRVEDAYGPLCLRHCVEAFYALAADKMDVAINASLDRAATLRAVEQQFRGEA